MNSRAVRILHVGTRAAPCPACGRQCACPPVCDPGPSVAELKRLREELIEMMQVPEPEEPYDPVPPQLRAQPSRGKMRKAQRGLEFSSPRGLRAHRRQNR